jgi:adenylate kinase family enzyme
VVAADGWVVDGNYRAVRPLVRERATHIVWLDLPRWRVMLQVVRRTIVRVGLRRELWNGNRERWRNFFSLDPMESIIVWAWTTHGRRRREYEEQVDERWVRLRSRREVRAWLDSL